MSKLKIAIITGTTRAARFGHKLAQWIRDIAAQREDVETEIVDLRDFPMPFFDEGGRGRSRPRAARTYCTPRPSVKTTFR